MKHYGDITKISGYDAPIVDCVIGGSPCQDLSIAGKREGLAGERSGLYDHQIRIVEEMRERDRRMGRTGADVRPRYMVWENVPGAFSSNGGRDFQVVLEKIAKVADKDAAVPMPPKGKWTNSGCIVGDGWSVAWRVLDAQFWGTSSKPLPQRRRRIALVADFGGQSASEILFVRQSVSGDLDESKPKREAVTSASQGSVGAYDSDGACPYTLKIRSGCDGGEKGALIQTDKSATLSTLQDQTLFQPIACFSKTKRAQTADDYESWVESEKTNTLNAFDVGDVRTTEAVVYSLDRASFNQGKNAQFDFEISNKGVSAPSRREGPSAVCYSVDQGGGKSACNVTKGQAPTLACTHVGEPAVAYCIGNGQADQTYLQKTVGTLNCMHDQQAVITSDVARHRYIVRRLTPLECERLQGFPDGWTDIGEWVDSNGKKRQTSDAARHKALGNSIALPPWKWVLKRLCACYERDATMASLFDGIGGFPYIWEQLNGKGSCLWASEIEEFPMAVTKVRIGGDT